MKPILFTLHFLIASTLLSYSQDTLVFELTEPDLSDSTLQIPVVLSSVDTINSKDFSLEINDTNLSLLEIMSHMNYLYEPSESLNKEYSNSVQRSGVNGRARAGM